MGTLGWRKVFCLHGHERAVVGTKPLPSSGCKACERVRVRRKPTPEEVRRNNLWKLYGMTVEQYDELLAAQGDVCKLCGKPPRRGRLQVDHEHGTRRIRGLLCMLCNRQIVRDHTIASVQALLGYLEANNKSMKDLRR